MRFHGVDLHKKYATISVRNAKGEQESLSTVHEIQEWVESLTDQDAVIVEASTGSMHWAEKIVARGSYCMVIDAYRFRIIRDSWQKTDKRDAANLSLALWMAFQNKEMKLPEVWQPSPTIRELRGLFGSYELLNKQIRQYKNQIHAMLLDNGVRDRELGKRIGTKPERVEQLLSGLQLSQASGVCIRMSCKMLEGLQESKSELVRQIMKAGKPLREEVQLLLSIRGVTPLLGLAFLAEVGEIARFKSVRQFLSYLGVVPTVRSSGGVTHSGSINRHSRGLARSLYTQGIPHLVDSSAGLKHFYEELRHRRGVGRARIAVLRKCFSMMRRMLLDKKVYRWVELPLYERKLKEYNRESEKNAKAA
jgi:transposase